MHRILATGVMLLTAVMSFAAETTSTPKKPITHEALWLMPRVGSPNPSPDGKQVVFNLVEPSPGYDPKNDVSDLWIVPADGSSKPRRLTSAKGSEGDVAWSPDSRSIAFTAKRGDDDVNQIYVLNVAVPGEAQRVTNLPLAARTPKWSPDGRKLLFMSAVYPGATDEETNRKLANERKDAKSKVRIYDSFPIRRWDKWLDETQTHLFVVDVNDDLQPAKSRDLLAGTKLIAGPGFGGRGSEGSSDTLDPAWAPDGKSIVFVATTKGNTAAYATVPVGLYEVSLSGGEPRSLTSDDRSYSQPKFSPDGKTLAFIVSTDAKRIYALERIASAPWPWNGTVNVLTSSFDRSAGGYDWAADGKALYFTAENEGHIPIYSVASKGGDVKLFMDAPRGVYGAVTIPGKSNVIFTTWKSAINPQEIVRIDPATKRQSFLTSFAVAQAAAIDWQPLREFWFTNKKGQKIHSFIALPPDFDEKKKYPLFVLMHGGAANMWTDSISLRWNYHLIGAPGYVVLATDYMGSTGYGEAFTLSLLGDPLRGPADDINAAADAAIAQLSFIDGSRQAAGGASYGGHLSNWMEATTTRYKCLITHAGLANLEAQWGTSDYIYDRELTALGPPWEQSVVWREQNPIRYAANFRTPMLLSTSENDFRVPLNNGLEMWSALQRMKVPSRLLVWPDENHWITKPENSRVFYREVHAWLAKWL